MIMRAPDSSRLAVREAEVLEKLLASTA